MTSTTTRVSIAKALRLRKQLKGQIADLARRAQGCVAVADGKAADFDFAAVNAERKAKIDRLVRLETAIARANAATTVVWQNREMPLTEVIRRQEELKGEITFVAGLTLQNGPVRSHTGEYDERRQPVYTTVQWKSAYTEPERVALLAELRAECEGLNELLEEANHRTTVEVDLP